VDSFQRSSDQNSEQKFTKKKKKILLNTLVKYCKNIYVEPYLSPKEFINTFYRDISQFLSKNFHKIGTKNKYVFRQNVLNVFSQTKKSLKVFGDLA
jgi:hypothetical protein